MPLPNAVVRQKVPRVRCCRATKQTLIPCLSCNFAYSYKLTLKNFDEGFPDLHRAPSPLCSEKDTISYSASLDVPMLREVQLDELAKAAGVVVINCLGISKGLQNGAVETRQ